MRRHDEFLRLFKMALAAGLSWYLAARVFPAHHMPYFAPLAVVITFQASVAETAAKAWYRIAGIIGGVMMAMAVSSWLHVGPVAIGLAVFLGAALSTALGLEAQIISQVGVTVVMVLASLATPHYAEYRIFESLLGAVVGVVVNALVLPANGVPLAEERALGVADLLRACLRDLARGNHPARGIAAQVTRALQALRAAESSLRLNPFAEAKRARLRELTLAMGALEQIAARVERIADSDADHAALSTALADAAAAVGAFGTFVARPSQEGLQQVLVAAGQAECSQIECLAALRETASLTEMRDLGAVLSDLSHILTAVQVEIRQRGQERAVRPSMAFSHE